MPIFAWIKPRNGHAILGFHDAVANVLSNNDSKVRYLQYHHITANMHNSRPAAEAQAQRDGATVFAGMKVKVFKGHYVYDLQTLPSRTGCWYIGSGASDLVVHQYLQGEHLQEVHAIVTFRHASGKLHIVTPRHNDPAGLAVNNHVNVNGHELEDGDIIRIGLMEFDFKYTSHFHTDNFHYESASVQFGKPRRPGSSRAPEVIQHYSLDAVVSEGMSGDLIQAHKMTQTNRVVAIKKMIREDANGPGPAQRKLATAIALNEIAEGSVSGSERVIHLIDYFARADHEYLVYPFIDVTLADIMKEGAQSIAVTQAYMRDMLQAAEFLHSNGYISGGLEPRNIGVREGNAVLLAVHSAVVCPQGEVRDRDPNGTGPAAYTAPEREFSEYSSAADIWSIAVIAIELQMGTHPWPTDINLCQRQSALVELRANKFNKPYRQIIKHLKQVGSPFCLLLRAMLSYEWAVKNFAPRPTASEALLHDGLKPEDGDDEDAEMAYE